MHTYQIVHRVKVSRMSMNMNMDKSQCKRNRNGEHKLSSVSIVKTNFALSSDNTINRVLYVLACSLTLSLTSFIIN